jgi:hypothetical protein
MAAKHDRALVSLTHMSERSQAFLKGLKHQVNDATEIGKDALSGNYSPERWFADVTALWVNGAALLGELYGVSSNHSDGKKKTEKAE